MKINRTVKVIKSAERNNPPVAAKAPATSGEGLKQTTREVAGQVAAWVKEFRQRPATDPRRAFASLFSDAASPLKSLS